MAARQHPTQRAEKGTQKTSEILISAGTDMWTWEQIQIASIIADTDSICSEKWAQ